MKNTWKNLSPITQNFLKGMLAAPIIWLFMVGFLLIGG